MWGCVACNNRWSFTSCVRSTACTVMDGFFPYLAQMITSMRGCVVCNNLSPWPISSRSFSHDLVIKLLKYGISCRVRSTACTVLEEFLPCLPQMINNMRGCVACNDLWSLPLSSRLFSCDVACFMDYFHMWHKYHPWGNDVSRTITRSIGQGHRSFMFLLSGRVGGWGVS